MNTTNDSKGLAFRMGQDLGFQRDPKHWSSEDMSSVSSPSNETRRRVYWGCFVSDKFVGLLNFHFAELDAYCL